MSRPGRPAVGEPIQIRLPADMLAGIDTTASAEGVTRSQWIRQAIAARLVASQPAEPTTITRHGTRIDIEGRNANPTATGHFDCYGDVHVIYCPDCGTVVGRSFWNGPQEDPELHCRYSARGYEADGGAERYLGETLTCRTDADAEVLVFHAHDAHEGDECPKPNRHRW